MSCLRIAITDKSWVRAMKSRSIIIEQPIGWSGRLMLELKSQKPLKNKVILE